MASQVARCRDVVVAVPLTATIIGKTGAEKERGSNPLRVVTLADMWCKGNPLGRPYHTFIAAAGDKESDYIKVWPSDL